MNSGRTSSMIRGAVPSSDPRDGRAARAPIVFVVYFLAALVLIGFCFSRSFRGIQGDGIFYYSYTASLLWDGDLDLKNQFDRPDPSAPQQTLTRGLYALDERTHLAFNSFNPGTGLLMIPGAALGRIVNGLTGKRHSDPFDIYYQTYAAFTAVILSSLTLVLLFSILLRFVSPGIAAVLPFLALLSSNWLFYATVFASWSHVYSLFLCAMLCWSFLRLMERRTYPAALIFGLAGGLFFTTRNFSVLFFLPLFGISAVYLFKTSPGRRAALARTGTTALSFLLGAAPQLVLNTVLHGSPLRTGASIMVTGQKIFGVPRASSMKVFDPANLEFLYSNLWNSDNGLFYFHLFFLAGLVGILVWTPRISARRGLPNALLAGIYALWFIDAGYWDNWFNRAAGSGFGQRRYLDLLPLFVFGAANLLEWSRRRRVWKLAAAALFSLLAAAGVSLTFRFQTDYRSYFAVRDSFADLYGFLLNNALVIAFAAAVFLLLLLLVKSRSGEPRLRARSPFVLLLFAALAILPALIFRPDPASERARFQTKRGFFLLYSDTPFVKLPGRSWGPAENMARPMLSSGATIKLPAPLEPEDLLLLAFSVAPQDASGGGFLELLLDGEPLGRAELKAGKQVAQFTVPPAFRPGRTLTLRLSGLSHAPAPVIFHEGRVVFRGASEPPFGYIDIPRDPAVIARRTALLVGWALADRGVARVFAALDRGTERAAAPGEAESPPLAEAVFSEGERPDVEGIYVLYPDIKRAAWKIFLDRKSLPAGNDRQTRLKIISVSNDGQKTVLGRRRIVWKD
jgi:hypothetical protein